MIDSSIFKAYDIRGIVGKTLTADVVRCGHGATAGAIDPVMMFYAQSRGLDPDDAERMIVRGFFEQVVSKIEDETIRERVLEALVARIGSSELLVDKAA